MKPVEYFIGQIVGYVQRRPKRRGPLPDYSGFPWWNVLRVLPNREAKSADRLKDVDVIVYLPTFKKSVCRRGGLRQSHDCAVMPGLLFVPEEMIAIDNREEVFDWAGVQELLTMRLSKRDLEELRRIEGKLNHPDSPLDAHGNEIHVGQRARFIDLRSVRLFGDGIVIEVASFRRIGLEVSGLFGGRVKVYTTADEIEVM